MDPAYAGMILEVSKIVEIKNRGPRVCGDDPVTGTATSATNEWTPRMRG